MLVNTIDISLDAIAQLLFMNRFHDTESKADITIEVASMTIMLFLIPTGFFVEKYGNRMAISMFVGVLFMICYTALMGALVDHSAPRGIPIFIEMCNGLNQVIMRVVQYNAISLLLPKRYLNYGFGVAFSLSNLAKGVTPISLGILYDNTKDQFFWPNLIIYSMVVITLILRVCLYFWDKHQRDGLLEAVDAMKKYQQYHHNGNKVPIAP